MKKKKLLWIALSVVVLFLIVAIAYIFKPMTMNDIYKEPNFAGVVTEVYEKAILVSVNQDEAEYTSSDLVSVSLNAKLKDSMRNFKVGDRVRVYYSGLMQYSYPAGVHDVYAILLDN